MKTNRIRFIASVCALLLLTQGCDKDKPLPDNPYDDIVRDDTTQGEIYVDSLTITYVHKKVLSSRCALPGCHDGNFEPDFRTPQSSFSTLVYATINKNNTAQSFKYRVLPYNKAQSVLYERVTNCCFVTQDDRMPQDNIGNILPDSSLNMIATWIDNGARDMFGQVAKLPNNEPVIQYYAAANTTFSTYYSLTENRIDSVYYNPFIIDQSISSFYIGVKVTDDSTAESQLQFNKLKISTSPNNFNGASTYTGTYFNGFGQSIWLVTIPATSLPMNDTLFMRYYVNDGQHQNNTEFPRNETLFPYKTYWSFIRQ